MTEVKETDYNLRMTLLEERYKSIDEKLDCIIRGDTVNCNTHRARMDRIEEHILQNTADRLRMIGEVEEKLKKKVEYVDFKILNDSITRTNVIFTKIAISVSVPVIVGIIFGIWEFVKFYIIHKGA